MQRPTAAPMPRPVTLAIALVVAVLLAAAVVAPAGAAIALQRNGVVMVAADDGSGVRAVGSVRQVGAASGTRVLVQLSPDARHVAAFTRQGRDDQRVVVFDAVTRRPGRVVALAQPLSFDWLDAGTLVVSTTARSSNDVYRVPVSGRSPRRIARFPFRPCTATDPLGEQGTSCGPRITDVTASPDGQRIAVGGQSGADALRLLTASGRLLATHGATGTGAYQVLGAAFSPDPARTLLTSELPNYQPASRITRVEGDGARKVIWTSTNDGSAGPSVAWSSDGAIGAFIGYHSVVADDPRIYAWRPSAFTVTPVGGVHTSAELASIAGFVDPSTAIVVGDQGRVGLLDATTGAIRPLLRSTMQGVDARPVALPAA